MLDDVDSWPEASTCKSNMQRNGQGDHTIVVARFNLVMCHTS